ncbi:MAG: hypothetical protein PVF51_07085 [Nitrospirota bacterium]
MVRTGGPSVELAFACVLPWAILIAGCATNVSTTEGKIVETLDDAETPAAQVANLETQVNRAGVPVELPRGAPAYLATVVHGLTASRVAVTELRTGHTMLLPETEAVPAAPVWAPDGSRILFRVEDELMAYDVQQSHLRRVATGLSQGGRTPYAYSPDGERIAVAEATVIHVLSASRHGGDGAERFTLPEGTTFLQLLWAVDGRTLLVLTQREDGGTPSLVWIDLADKAARVQPVYHVTGLLGWDASTSALVVVHLDPERMGDEAAVRLPSGEVRALREAEEDDAGEFVVAYRPDTRQTVVSLGTEDLGDPTKLLILPPDNAPARSWLEAFPRLDELSISADGGWAAFVDRSPVYDTGEVGGDIYAVPFGSDTPVLVLKADPDTCTFTTPVLRP